MYAIVIASLVIDLFATLVSGLEWLDHVSLFHYMALAPAQTVDAVTVVLTLAVAAALLTAAASPLHPPRRLHRLIPPATNVGSFLGALTPQ